MYNLHRSLHRTLNTDTIVIHIPLITQFIALIKNSLRGNLEGENIIN